MNYNDYDDEDDRPPIPAPQSLNRETVEPWFVLDENEEESKLNSPETKSAAKKLMSLIISLALLGLFIYGGYALWTMFMNVWGENQL